MNDEVGSNAVGVSAPNSPVQTTQVCPNGKQLIVYGIGMSFNGTPGTPVLAQLVDPDVSPNPVLWEGYVGQARDVTFEAGQAIPPGHAAALQLGAGGAALIGVATIHYVAK